MHDRTIICVGKVEKRVKVSRCITRMVHYAKGPATNSSCLSLCKHINVVVKPLGRKPSFTLAVILLLAGRVSIYYVAKTFILIYMMLFPDFDLFFILSDFISCKHVDVLATAEILLSKDDTVCVLSGCMGSNVLSTEQS